MKVLDTIRRVLTFRLTREEVLRFERKHFIAGLIGSWLAGIGRYWDDKSASLLQHLGIGSVIYIFLLALFIWIIVIPFLIEGWTYFRVLTFISLTSFPAILYATPVEKFFSTEIANSINAWFLAIVAGWRLMLLYYFLKRFTGLGVGDIFTITMMPICLIITTLTILNLNLAVFDIMGGRRNATPHDSAYAFFIFLTIVCVLLTIPLIIAFVVGVFARRKKLKKVEEK